MLTPLAFDPGHPFPYISNRSKNFAVVVESDGRTRFARVKVPDVLPRFVAVPPLFSGRRGLTFALLEDVIRLNLGQLFPGMEIVDAHLFRVIRETDIVLQEDDPSICSSRSIRDFVRPATASSRFSRLTPTCRRACWTS